MTDTSPEASLLTKSRGPSRGLQGSGAVEGLVAGVASALPRLAEPGERLQAARTKASRTADASKRMIVAGELTSAIAINALLAAAPSRW
jgi:hypothetical protein